MLHVCIYTSVTYTSITCSASLPLKPARWPPSRQDSGPESPWDTVWRQNRNAESMSTLSSPDFDTKRFQSYVCGPITCPWIPNQYNGPSQNTAAEPRRTSKSSAVLASQTKRWPQSEPSTVLNRKSVKVVLHSSPRKKTRKNKTEKERDARDATVQLCKLMVHS